jgi:hypothetical protein
MAYVIRDLCEAFGSPGKPVSRVTIWRWVKAGIIPGPDMGGHGTGAQPRWLTLPLQVPPTSPGVELTAVGLP